MSAVNKPLSIAIPANLPENLSRHFPAEVAVVRYDVDGTDTHDVDVLVPQSFGPKAPEVLPRIRCRYIQMASAGVETMLPLVPAGVTLCNAQGVHDSSTAEWVVTAILASLKWLPFYAQHQFAGHWAAREESDPFYEATFGAPNSVGNVVLTEEVKGSQVLIVGYGSIGKAIEQRLLPFEPREVVRVARSAKPGVHAITALDSLLPDADIVVLMTPMTPETRHLMDARRMALMRRGAVLVNAARGPVIDTDALVEALYQRKIRAALDVTDPEPLPSGHPLWKAPGLLLTPHIAGSTPLFLEKVYQFIGQQLALLLRGEEPRNIIRGEY
jgi:phosphoglycerate dehydrogenase-like enzyme